MIKVYVSWVEKEKKNSPSIITPDEHLVRAWLNSDHGSVDIKLSQLQQILVERLWSERNGSHFPVLGQKHGGYVATVVVVVNGFEYGILYGAFGLGQTEEENEKEEYTLSKKKTYSKEKKIGKKWTVQL